ncbi:hypothetical protein, partial [Streptomyces sp. NPDC055036]
MIGLFWIEHDTVCLGAPSIEEDPGVFLSPTRLSVGEHAWLWGDVTDLQVLDVPVRSATVRWATRVTTVVAAALNAWGPSGPSMMTAVVHAQDQRVETPVFSAAATAYTQREVDLSLGLLSHFEGSRVFRTGIWPLISRGDSQLLVFGVDFARR